MASDCGHRDDASFSARQIDLRAFLAGLARCPISIEACATARHLARKLIAFGWQVRLVPPSDLKADVNRGKSDAADAEGTICQTVT